MVEKGSYRAALSPAKLDDIREAVRAFCVIYHTSLMYRTGHAVFRSAVEERFPIFEKAMEGLPALSLDFTAGQIRVADTPLEPGSGVFQKVARAFEVLGVRNVTFLPGIDAEALMRLIELMGEDAEAIRRDGLDAVLKRADLRTIRSFEMVAKLSKATGARPARGQAKVEHETDELPAGGSSASGGGVWQIDDFTPADSGAPAAVDGVEHPHARSVRDFVAGVLGAMTRREAQPDDVAEIISMELEHRIEEKMAVVRRESERKIRRLEAVKELILDELQRLSIAAVIIDAGMHVLAMNMLAESFFGAMDEAVQGSALETFIRSGLDQQELDFKGEKRTVRLITKSSSGSGEDLMLVTLEKH